eukprot:129416-Amphidinium_carterae.1
MNDFPRNAYMVHGHKRGTLPVVLIAYMRKDTSSLSGGVLMVGATPLLGTVPQNGPHAVALAHHVADRASCSLV